MRHQALQQILKLVSFYTTTDPQTATSPFFTYLTDKYAAGKTRTW